MEMIYFIVLIAISTLAFLVMYSNGNHPISLINLAENIVLMIAQLIYFSPSEILLKKTLIFAQSIVDIDIEFDKGFKDVLASYIRMMTTDFHKQQIVSCIGYALMKTELFTMWLRRLRFTKYLKENSHILQIPVIRPVILIGLPRSGSTYLQRLLAMDTQFRSPLLWELLNPVPLVSSSSSNMEKRKDMEKRANKVKYMLEKRYSVLPSTLDVIHPLQWSSPEECVFWLNNDAPVCAFLLNSCYMAGNTLLQMQLGDVVYANYTKLLQLLSSQSDNNNDVQRWLLKCPFHLFFLKDIERYFPDAQLIWSHRHPASAVPSMCSLLSTVHSQYYHHSSSAAKQKYQKALGAAIQSVSGNLLIESLAFLDSNDSHLDCAHVAFQDLVADPISTIKNIYEELGWIFTEAYEERLQKYIDEDRTQREKLCKQQRGGKEQYPSKFLSAHAYSGEEFGLDKKILCSGKFDAYIERFRLFDM